MSGTDPVLHVIAGPNGAGKSTLYSAVLGPATHLAFVNADLIATQRWPGAETVHAYSAATLAAEER
ncbi:MAG TPA: AAA family ATPase, partial [Nakamurella sp.]